MSPSRELPRHLTPYVAKQDASLYNAIDHASWRFIMLLSKKYFSKHAYKVYLDGLEKTGINTERIPLISEMDEKLQKFGWRAIPIIGFIPPAPFMEFLSLGILPIACDMRKVENIDYTPAPDIVHEAAGHAPILADPGFAKYLLGYGEIARKVIYTHQDETLYEKIRILSDLKENPATTKAEIEHAQKAMEDAAASVVEVSEAAELTRMGWWTFEYGLIGPLDNPKIYGAGLLSSVGESYHCFDATVKKVPFSIDCIKQAFDITKPQPQLFVTPDFETLTRELEKLANTMGFRRGGLESLEKVKRAATVTTTQFESGIEIGGILTEIYYNSQKTEAVYLQYKGPCQLAFLDEEIEGHGPQAHRDGFGTPIGKIKTLNKSPAELTNVDLVSLGFVGDKKSKLEFESGVVVEGILRKRLIRGGKNLILTFHDCKVSLGDKTLYRPEWGLYDMACGMKAVSVFGGAPDRGAYIEGTTGFGHTHPSQSSNMTPENRDLIPLYAKVREIRDRFKESKTIDKNSVLQELNLVQQKLERNFSDDWLLRFELLELDHQFKLQSLWSAKLKIDLDRISKNSKAKENLIKRGLELLQ